MHKGGLDASNQPSDPRGLPRADLLWPGDNPRGSLDNAFPPEWQIMQSSSAA
jgi:hypothetical protein